MAYSINKVTLLGNVGKDPEIKTFPSGDKVANFSLATTESWKDKTTGEKKSVTEWHNITVKNDKLVGIIEKYVKKGSKLHIEGKLETRKYEKDGSNRYITEIVLYPHNGEIVLLDPKVDEHLGDDPSRPARNPKPDPDDNIPF
jgi:single-strand DNA-binding protein